MSDAKGAVTHVFPDRGAGEWVALEDYAALQAENERLRAAQTWQPIETAPKDRRGILVWDADNEWQCEAWWDGPNTWECPHGDVSPTHWMSLLKNNPTP
jgi:hypothetical protein